MSRKQEERRPPGEGEEGGLLEAVVRDNVMHELGSPGGPHRVQVREVFGGSYRVNVFVGDAGSSRVAHSFFVRADGDGKILSSSPAIARLY